MKSEKGKHCFLETNKSYYDRDAEFIKKKLIRKTILILSYITLIGPTWITFAAPSVMARGQV